MTNQGSITVGDRARLWIGPPKRGGLRYGEVIGVDNLDRPGVQIRFDRPVNGCDTCYATQAEVEVLREHLVHYANGSPTREVEERWERVA